MRKLLLSIGVLLVIIGLVFSWFLGYKGLYIAMLLSFMLVLSNIFTTISYYYKPKLKLNGIRYTP